MNEENHKNHTLVHELIDEMEAQAKNLENPEQHMPVLPVWLTSRWNKTANACI